MVWEGRAMTKRYDAVKERKWRRVLERWRRSGLSIRAFCGAEGIGEHLFYWWRRELARRDQHKAAAHKRVTGTDRPPRAPGQRPPFCLATSGAKKTAGPTACAIKPWTAKRNQPPKPGPKPPRPS